MQDIMSPIEGFYAERSSGIELIGLDSSTVGLKYSGSWGRSFTSASILKGTQLVFPSALPTPLSNAQNPRQIALIAYGVKLFPLISCKFGRHVRLSLDSNHHLSVGFILEFEDRILPVGEMNEFPDHVLKLPDRFAEFDKEIQVQA